MNLIEQLGGYGEAKAFLNDSNGADWNGVFYMPKLKKSLLQYRREHNIFEVGDWLVNIKTGTIGDFIKYIELNGGHKHCFVDIGLCDPAVFCLKNLRHATTEEIKAGRRL